MPPTEVPTSLSVMHPMKTQATKILNFYAFDEKSTNQYLQFMLVLRPLKIPPTKNNYLTFCDASDEYATDQMYQ
jgi:hypothetical protein